MDSTLKLELLKNKTENARSAVASQEVLEHLAGFIRSKRQTSRAESQRDAGSACCSSVSETQRSQTESCYNTPSLSLGASQDDHPLRKTASMPTLHLAYKAQSISRRRQMERRTTMSPLMRGKRARARRSPLVQQLSQQLADASESNSSATAEYHSSNPCMLHEPPASGGAGTSGAGKSARSLSQSSSSPPIQSEPLPEFREHWSAAGAATSGGCSQEAGQQSAKSLSLSRQQHLKVREAIKETLTARAGGRNQRLAATGSLGAGEPLRLQRLQPAPSHELGEPAAAAAHESGPSLAHFRQWSLDGAELAGLGEPAARRCARAAEPQKRRLPAEECASSARHSRAPNSSISMGLLPQVGGQPTAAAATTAASGAPAHQPPRSLARPLLGLLAHNRHLYSSSSSSTSSLLSQQDSLEDSPSSQAMDLSSSSELQRTRLRAPGAKPPPSQPGHKGLQESFRQLQLCAPPEAPPAQAEPLSLELPSEPAPAPAARHAASQEEQAAAQVRAAGERTNLSASVQSLMASSRAAYAAPGGQAPDLSQLLLVYKSLLQADGVAAPVCGLLKPDLVAHLLQQQPAQLGVPLEQAAGGAELQQRNALAVGRTFSSPVLVAAPAQDKSAADETSLDLSRAGQLSAPRTGLAYDAAMCEHKCVCGNEAGHPESSFRILAIWRRLQDKGLVVRCARVNPRRANLDELKLCHSETYVHYFGKTPSERAKLSQLDLSQLPIESLTRLDCGGQGADIDSVWNEELTPHVARLATGCVIEATLAVASGRLLNAFAIVRPPGHHAEFQQAMGFCFFNSVAVAAALLVRRHHVGRVLIVDWDVHHGNGIQRLFYEDQRVMYISLHRHDRGTFFPGTGDARDVGQGLGRGYNWNVAWCNEPMGDAEYLVAFRAIVMPIARDYNPSIVLVASGFDAAKGHALNFGGYLLSPACFAYMTRQLMSLAGGRLVLCLEGGYQLAAISDCAECCVRALLHESHLEPMDEISDSELRRPPNQSACETLYELSTLAAKYWPSVLRWRCTIELSVLAAAAVGLAS